MDITNISLAAYLATFLPGVIAFVSPLIASFVSREHLPSELTAGITVGLVAAGAFLTQFIQDGHYSFTLATLKAFLAYIIAAEARARVWAGTSTDEKALAWPRKLPKKNKLMSHSAGVADDETAVEPTV